MPFDASPVDSEVVTVLKKARALIDSPEKWAHGYGRFLERRCVSVAIQDTQPDAADARNTEAVALAHECLGFAVIGETYFSPCQIFNWNDAKGRTHSDVMEAFDKAIILAGGTP